MFSKEDLQQLAEYHSEHPVVSLTLNVDPTRRTRDEYRLTLRHLLRSVNGRANGDAARIESFFEHEYDWTGRGLAIFSNQHDNFWRVYTLAVPIGDSIVIGSKPHITPLANLWDVYGRFVAAIVDRQGARFIFVQLGEIVDGEGVLGEEVRRTKSGVGSTPRRRRRESDAPTDRQEIEKVKRNIKDSAAALVAFCEKHTPRYVVLGGNAEVIGDLREHLPQPWAERIIGTLTADITESDLVIRDRSLKLMADYEVQREAELADAAITAAAKGSGGAARLGDVLRAAHAGQVQTLLVAEGFKSPGYRCGQCGYLSAQSMARCPFCSGMFEQIPDAVEAVISKVVEQKGRVEVVSGHMGLTEAGIAALLRY
ncbi:MAG: host attachment protein [Anaerolineae bacterium]